jgi:hypothetical protein
VHQVGYNKLIDIMMHGQRNIKIFDSLLLGSSTSLQRGWVKPLISEFAARRRFTTTNHSETIFS